MDHHYVPQFLLRQWATGGKFTAYRWLDAAQKVVVNTNAGVRSACQIPDLNAYLGVPTDQQHYPETGYFTPAVDTPAASALQVLLSDGVSELSPRQRTDWARFLVSFGVRTPEALRAMGPDETRKAFDLMEKLASGPPEMEARASAILKANMDKLERNFPLNAAIDISSDPAKLSQVAGMTWWLRRWDRPALLIGDRPLLAYPRMPYPCGIALNNPSCLIVLPIAPDTAFLASADPKSRAKVRKMTYGVMARTINAEMIERSHSVYFADDSLKDFVSPKLAAKAARPSKT